MRVANNTTSSVNPENGDPKTGADDSRENLKKTLQDPNTSTPDAMTALHKLFMLDSKKMAAGNASEEEANEYRLIEQLRSGKISEADSEALGSQLGISQERLAELNKQFQPNANHSEPSSLDIM